MIILIMAGGLGKRMDSDIPKVLHEVVNPEVVNPKVVNPKVVNPEKLPMLIHVIRTALKLNPSKIYIIVGKYKYTIEKQINYYIKNNIISDNIDYIIVYKIP